MKDKKTLIRVACNKQGDINIDPTSKKPGRAAYLCTDNAECLRMAKKIRGLERSLKRQIPLEIYVQLENHIENHLVLQ